MSLARLLAQRIALGLVAAWTVLTGVFLLFTATEDWQLSERLAIAGRGPTDPETIEQIRQQYLAQRGLDRPLWEQYVDWMGNMVTLQWGTSFQSGQDVFPYVMDSAWRTGTYVVPGLAIATVLGLAIGLYATMSDGWFFEGSLRSTAYLVFGVPNFVLGAVVLALAAVGYRIPWRADFIPPSELPFEYQVLLPALLVTTTLVAAIASYARAYSSQYAAEDSTKLIRAKGGSRLDVCRHVLRNAAIPIVSILFVETLALVALSVFVVEALFGIQGLGLLFYNAVWSRDLPVMLGGTVVVVGVGVVGNILQDLAYSALDPRVDTGIR